MSYVKYNQIRFNFNILVHTKQPCIVANRYAYWTENITEMPLGPGPTGPYWRS